MLQKLLTKNVGTGVAQTTSTAEMLNIIGQ